MVENTAIFYGHNSLWHYVLYFSNQIMQQQQVNDAQRTLWFQFNLVLSLWKWWSWKWSEWVLFYTIKYQQTMCYRPSPQSSFILFLRANHWMLQVILLIVLSRKWEEFYDDQNIINGNSHNHSHFLPNFPFFMR